MECAVVAQNSVTPYSSYLFASAFRTSLDKIVKTLYYLVGTNIVPNFRQQNKEEDRCQLNKISWWPTGFLRMPTIPEILTCWTSFSRQTMSIRKRRQEHQPGQRASNRLFRCFAQLSPTCTLPSKTRSQKAIRL